MQPLRPSEAALNLSFDIFQRYAAVAEILCAAYPDEQSAPIRILDVASGDAAFLQEFLPRDRFDVFYFDKGMSAWRTGDPHFIRGDAREIEFPNAHFDAACCVDLLEHLPRGDREQVIDEILRVAQGPVAILFPCAEDQVEYYEDLANSLFRDVVGESNKWLTQHQVLGLPSVREAAQYLSERSGGEVQVLSNGFLPRWAEMVVFNLILRRLKPESRLPSLVCYYYNKNIYPYDNKEPCYRRVLVARHPRTVVLGHQEEDEAFKERYAQLRRLTDMALRFLQMGDLHRDEAKISEVARAAGTAGSVSDKALSRLADELEVASEARRKLEQDLLEVYGRVDAARKRLLVVEEERGRQLSDLQARLQKEQDTAEEREKQLSDLQARLQKEQDTAEEREKQLSDLRARLKKAQDRNLRLARSFTYRTGQAVLWPLKSLRGVFSIGMSRAGATVSKESVRIVQFTPPDPQNPFYSMLIEELRRLGWRANYDDQPARLLKTIKSHQHQRFLVLFHQFDPYVRGRNGEPARQQAQLFARELLRIKRSGARLVWVMHNSMPHDAARAATEAELVLRRFVRKHFAAVVVLNHAGHDEALEYFPEEMISVIPHPSFVGVHGAPVEQVDARKRLGFPPGAFIFGSLGALRPYKGLEMTIDAFRGMEKDNAQLVLVGEGKDAEYVAALRRRSAGDQRIRLVADGPVADRDVPTWLAAFDVAVFGFKSILTSGSVILALSYGLPVIAPALGGIPEVVIPDQTGILFEAGNVESMRDAMTRIPGHPLLAHMRYMAMPSLQEVAASAVAEQWAEVFQRVFNVHLED